MVIRKGKRMIFFSFILDGPGGDNSYLTSGSSTTPRTVRFIKDGE